MGEANGWVVISVTSLCKPIRNKGCEARDREVIMSPKEPQFLSHQFTEGITNSPGGGGGED